MISFSLALLGITLFLASFIPYAKFLRTEILFDRIPYRDLRDAAVVILIISIAIKLQGW
ncbi:MAG: hypothetical protein Q7R73_05445 [bacterium]|nr:hypothetical protein [bacterium]